MLTLAQQLEQLVSLGILLVGAFLTVLSAVAWRREHDRKMAIVALAYGMFALYGLVSFAEYFLVEYRVPLPFSVELLEHLVSVLILFGLVAFFAALTRD